MAVVGIGIDAVSIERMRRAADASERGLRFRARVFTEHERATCERRPDPAEGFAARFAAKEAVMKALGAEGIGFAFREIEVTRAESGAPSVVLHGRVAERARQVGAGRIHVSLTHAEPLALASVVVEAEAP